MRICKWIAIILLAVSISLNAGELKLSKDKPAVNDIINVEYTPDNRFDEGSKFKLIVYYFIEGEDLPTAKEYELKRSEEADIFKSNILVLPNTQFALMKVYGSSGFTEFDENRGEFWDFLVYKNEKAVADANLKKAFSYLGNLNDNYTRDPDFEAAKAALEEELEHYPNNLQAEIAYKTLKLDFKLIDFDEYEKEIRSLLDRKINMNDVSTLKTIVRTLYTINERSKGDQLKKDVISKDEISGFAREELMDKISKAKSFEEFIELTLKYIEKYSKIDRNIENVYSGFVAAHLQADYISKLDENLNKLDYVPPYVYSNIAIEYLNNDKLLERFNISQRVNKINSYIDSAYSSLENFDVMKPVDISPIEWDLSRQKLRSDILLMEYEFYNITGDTTKAFEKLGMSIETAPHRVNKAAFDRYLDMALELNNYNKAEDIIEIAYLNNKNSSDFEIKVLESLDSLPNISVDDINNYKSDQVHNRRLLLEHQLNREEQRMSGFVQLKDESFYDLDNLEGKLTFVLVFTSWCGPCEDIYGAFNEIYHSYENEQDVSFIGLSIWEGKDAFKNIEDLKEEFDISFPIFIDNSNILARKLDIFGFPTVAAVDSEGMIRYKIRGYSGKEDLEQTIEDLIEVME